MPKPFRPYGNLSGAPGEVIQSLVIEKSPAVIEVPVLRKVFDFTYLFQVTSVELASKSSIILGREFSKYARATAVARAHFFELIVEHIVGNDELLTAFCNGGTISRLGDRPSWEAALSSWFKAGVEAHSPNRLTTFGEIVNGLRRVYKALERNGLVPRVTFPKMKRNYHIGRGTRPSLIEVKKRDEMFVDVVQLVKERAVEYGASEDSVDLEFLRDLGDRVPPELIGSRDAFMTAMREVNTELLDNLRKLAEEQFLLGYADFQEGKRLIQSANAEDVTRIDKLITAYKSGAKFKSIKRELSRILIECEPDDGLSVLLAYFHKHNNGVAFFGLRRELEVIVFLNKLYRHLGGVRRITRLLGGDPNTIASAMLIYMVDSGANPSVVTELTIDCMQAANEPGKFVIDSVKGRADWKIIVKQFERSEAGVKISVPDVIDRTVEMTSGMRLGFPDLGHYLFIFRWYEIPSVASGDFLANRLRYLVRDAGLQENLYRAERIRQSFLIEFTLEADGNKRLAEIVAGHKKPNGSTINAYTDRWPVRILLSRKIIQFQTLLQYDVLFNGLGLDEALGISKPAAHRILESAERTGYGIRCRNSKWGANSSAKSGEDCSDPGAACLECRAKIIVPDEESIRDIVRGKRALETQQFEQEANSSRRWESEGLPLLAFYIAAIEKLKRSPFARLLNRILKEEGEGNDVADEVDGECQHQ